jgi:hypothetical protein
MAGLQTIVNYSDSLTINRRRLVSVQYTRSEIAKVNETASRNPWRFSLGISAALRYQDSRELLEQLDYLDRTRAEIISFNQSTGASSGLAYMFAYQGALTQGVLDQITVASFSGNRLVLNVPAMATGTVIFKKGDYIQIKGFPYPFTSTTDVVKAAGSTVVVTTHRPNFISNIGTTPGINVGNAVQFRMLCINMPTPKLSPGGSNAIVTWGSGFELYEYTGDVL